jgi:hypothetical protein
VRDGKLRNTKYAEELARAVLKLPSGDEARIERLRMKKTDTVEIRFSWWKEGRIVPRPLDLPETTLTKLLAAGIREGVLLLPLPEKDPN